MTGFLCSFRALLKIAFVDQASLDRTHSALPASASRVLVLKTCATFKTCATAKLSSHALIDYSTDMNIEVALSELSGLEI